MNELQKIMEEFTDKFFDVYPDEEGIWGKPVITITFGDFRKAATEYAAMQARIDTLEKLLLKCKDAVEYTAEFDKEDMQTYQEIIKALK